MTDVYICDINDKLHTADTDMTFRCTLPAASSGLASLYSDPKGREGLRERSYSPVVVLDLGLIVIMTSAVAV